MKLAKDIAGLACLSLTAIILSLVLFHLPGWLRGMDQLQQRAQEVAGNAQVASERLSAAADSWNQSSTDTMNLTGTVLRFLGGPGHPGFLQRLDESVAGVNQLTTHTTQQVDSIGKQTVFSMSNLDQQIEAISGETRLTLWGVRPVLHEAEGLLADSRFFIRGPLTASTQDVSAVLKPTALMLTDWQLKSHQFLFPPKQSRWVKAYKVVRGISPLVQPTYFGVRLVRENLDWP